MRNGPAVSTLQAELRKAGLPVIRLIRASKLHSCRLSSMLNLHLRPNTEELFKLQEGLMVIGLNPELAMGLVAEFDAKVVSRGEK